MFINSFFTTLLDKRRNNSEMKHKEYDILKRMAQHIENSKLFMLKLNIKICWGAGE